MDTIFMNFHSFLLNLSDKINLKMSDKNVALSNLSIYYTWKNKVIKTMDLNNEFEFLDGSYSISDIQDYFEYVFKNHETLSDNPQMKLLTFLTFKWVLSWTFNKWTDEITWKHWKNITKNKNSENTPNLEITEVVSGFNNYHKIAIRDHIRVP